MTARTPQPPGSQTPSPLRPCDLFSEEIHLLVDGELGVAETAVVEEHLQGCPRCQTLASRLEAMSSLLKDWDTRENDMPAPALRLKHAVLSRVNEHSMRRRRESRLVGLLHYATAALVLVALGAGVALGLSQHTEAEPAAAIEISDAAWPLDTATERAIELPAHRTHAALADWAATVDTTPLPRATIDAPAHEPDWDRLGPWAQVWQEREGVERLTFLVDRIERREVFRERVGAPVTAWPGPRLDEPGQRLMTVRAYNYLHDRGYIQEWVRASPAPHEAASRTVVADATQPVGGQATDMTAADMLAPLPGIDRELKTLFRNGRLSAFTLGTPKAGAKAPAALEAWPIRLESQAGLLSSGPLRTAPRRFLDPLKAEANDKLRLREQDDGKGSVVFIVKGTTEAIFIPAGQFIDGGWGARVVAEPTWLPAARAETPHIVRCRMVEDSEAGEPKGHPTLVPFVAGPTVRSLLAAEASSLEIKAAAKRIYKLRQHAEYDLFNGWNLLEVYGGKNAAGYQKTFGSAMAWSKGRGGFAVRDAAGRLVGLEVVRFQGPAAEALLSRLWIGYVVEAVLRQGRLHPANPALTRTKAEVDAALAPSSDEFTQAFHRIANHPAVFRTPRGFDASRGWRVSNLEIVAAGLQLQGFEIGNQAMVVSATTTPVR